MSDVEDGFAASVTVHRDTSELTAYRPPAESNPSLTVRVYVDILGFRRRPRLGQSHRHRRSRADGQALEQNLLRVLHEQATEDPP